MESPPTTQKIYLTIPPCMNFRGQLQSVHSHIRVLQLKVSQDVDLAMWPLARVRIDNIFEIIDPHLYIHYTTFTPGLRLKSLYTWVTYELGFHVTNFIKRHLAVGSAVLIHYGSFMVEHPPSRRRLLLDDTSVYYCSSELLDIPRSGVWWS